MVDTEKPFDYGKMPVGQLGNFAMVENIFLKHKDQEGLLIGVMDMEPTKNAIKVLVNGKFQYWPTDNVSFVRSEPRRWERT